MIDLSQAKPGDAVNFRCGGHAKIYTIELNPPTYHVVLDGTHLCYTAEGKCAAGKSLYDIVGVENDL